MPALAAALSLGACSETGLQAFQEPGPPPQDDQLSIAARVCTAPALESVFPVKILFVVDTSDSMSVTDRQGLRAQAVVNVLNRYAGNPAIEFGVIAFDAFVEVVTPEFTNNPDIGAISTRLATADRLTDYQGALGAAYSFLARDMAANGPAERARSKYVVIFFTDGAPDPECSDELDEGDTFLICEVPRQDWASAFDPPVPPEVFPDLLAGGDYNQPEQINASVEEIVALQDFFKVGEVRLHTAFLFDPAAASDPLALPFDLDRDAGVALLTEMARHGKGTFTEFSAATSIDFLDFDYASIREPNVLVGLLATNVNALFTDGALVADTDGDGLSDETETVLGTCLGPTATCADATDSDGDGFGDLLEEHHRSAGFDPLDATRPSQACSARSDTDGDGLRDCEELYLGTDSRLFDSDADRLSDAIEVRAGVDALENDAQDDDDHDGMRNVDELRAHLDPRAANRFGHEDFAYGYQADEQPQGTDGRTCYDLTVRKIRLVTTGRATQAQLGDNRVFVHFVEGTADRPYDYGALRVACVDTRYVDGVIKSPPSGFVQLEDEDFVSPTTANPCLDLRGGSSAGADGGAP